MSAAAQTPKPDPKTKAGPDDDVVGKVYDGRLMRRLLTYLRPYKLQTGLSAACILLRAGTDVVGPFLVKVAIDTYMTPNPSPTWASRHLSPVAPTGVTELSLLYLAALTISFALDFVQTYLMQWTGQKIMFDLRREISATSSSRMSASSTRIPSAASSPASPPTSTRSTRCSPRACSKSSATP
jgi:ATP-binding cassette subfamily B protein